MMEQETRYRQLTQEQLDSFTLDMNAAYARLKGVEEAIDSKTPGLSPLCIHSFVFIVGCVYNRLMT